MQWMKMMVKWLYAGLRSHPAGGYWILVPLEQHLLDEDAADQTALVATSQAPMDIYVYVLVPPLL